MWWACLSDEKMSASCVLDDGAAKNLTAVFTALFTCSAANGSHKVSSLGSSAVDAVAVAAIWSKVASRRHFDQIGVHTWPPNKIVLAWWSHSSRERVSCQASAMKPQKLTPYSAEVIIVPHRSSCYTGRWWVSCYIWYSEEGTGRGRSPPRPLLTVPNVTAHPSRASVPITVLLYSCPLLCGFNLPVKR